MVTALNSSHDQAKSFSEPSDNDFFVAALSAALGQGSEVGQALTTATTEVVSPSPPASRLAGKTDEIKTLAGVSDNDFFVATLSNALRQSRELDQY